MPLKHYKQALIFIVFLFLAYFPLFHHLDSHSLRMWDEAIYAVNAFEMSQNHDFICRHYDGKPILWNPKPPLVTWIQVVSFKVLGYSELSFRLPVALFCLFTGLSLVWFLRKEFNSISLGYFSAFVLFTAPGYIHFHVARTGDPDGVLTFFVLMYCLIFYKWIEDVSNKKLFYLFAFLVFCAVFTKSFAGLVAMPALLIWAIYRSKLKEVLSKPFVYIGSFAVVAVVLGYYILHEFKTPGFIDSVLQKESGRYSALVQHGESFWFYLIKMWEGKFLPWIYLIPISFGLIYSEKNKSLKKFIQFTSLISVSYLIILSLSKTKLIWYIAPMYPFLSILCGYVLFRTLRSLIKIGNNSLRLGATAAMILLLMFPYYVILDKVMKRQDNPGERYAYYISKLKEEMPEFAINTIVISSLNPHVSFYRQFYNYRDSLDIEINFPRQIEVGDSVISCDYISIDCLVNKFEVSTLDSYRNCKYLTIDGIRQH
ncbi:MAG: hypothetical protein HKN92_10045 [Chitinophagales bacterium]|nr:hypothetical protein [Chitinophagales bacterium]